MGELGGVLVGGGCAVQGFREGSYLHLGGFGLCDLHFVLLRCRLLSRYVG